jgi:ParB-like chromosome segregation protein Spo0J
MSLPSVARNREALPEKEEAMDTEATTELEAMLKRCGATYTALNRAPYGCATGRSDIGLQMRELLRDVTASEEAQAATEPTTKPEARNIPIKDIETDESYRLRRINEEAVAEKMESIREVGLLHPITVTVRDTRRSGRTIYLLRAGLHRLEACKRLKWKEIPATISPLTGLRARLIEVDENLMQTKLSREQRIRFTAERKKIYEALYPETKHGGNQSSGGRFASPSRQIGETDESEVKTPSFVSATAATTGRSERSIARDAELGAKIAPDVLDEIEGTKLSTGQTYHELKNLSHDGQRERLKEKKAELEVKAPKPERSPNEKHTCDLQRLNKAWNAVLDAWREAEFSAKMECLQRIAEDPDEEICLAYRPVPISGSQAEQDDSDPLPPSPTLQ